MSTADPADVHTGTDRVELTEDERRQLWQGWQTPSIGYTTTIRVVESIVAARVQALTAERDEQERNAVFEHSNQAYAQGREVTAIQIAAERDAARAELAAANARCAELETGIAKLRDGMHEFMRGNWPESPTPVEVYSALAALTPEGKP